MLRGMIFFNTNLKTERGAQRDDFFNTNLEREREGLRGMIFFNTNLEREREGLSRLQDAKNCFKLNGCMEIVKQNNGAFM